MECGFEIKKLSYKQAFIFRLFSNKNPVGENVTVFLCFIQLSVCQCDTVGISLLGYKYSLSDECEVAFSILIALRLVSRCFPFSR